MKKIFALVLLLSILFLGTADAADQRIQYTEQMVGAGHPTLTDTINRHGIVEHNNDGTHGLLTQVIDPYVDIRAYLPDGYVTDGTADYSTQIQAAIDAVAAYTKGTGGKVLLPLGYWNLGTTGIELYEGIQLIGSGMSSLVSGVKAGGTWLVYTGTGNAITIDGEWTGFVSRRNITIENLNILTQSGVNAGVYADFATLFKIDRVYITGAATYGMYMTNSYNGVISSSKIEGATTNFYTTIKASPNDVFSGQTLIFDTDFHGALGKNVHIIAAENVMAQWVFLKSHFKAGLYGVYLEGANLHRVRFLNSHFEANTTNDLYIHSDVVQGPFVDGNHFNNNDAVYKIDCQGDNSQIVNNEFTGGSTGYGVKINGDNNRIAYNHFQGIASDQLLIDTSATFTIIGKNTFSVTSNRVVDNSTALSTTFEGETIIESKVFDLSGSADTDLHWIALTDYYVREVRVIYEEATSADAGSIVQFGDTSSANRYVQHTTDVSQGANSVVTPTLSSAYTANGRIFKFASAGGKTGTGTAKIIARLLPYPTD